jgi:hypothetical protein
LWYAFGRFTIWFEADYEVINCNIVHLSKSEYRLYDEYNWHKGLAAGGAIEGVKHFEDAWAAALHDQGLAQEYEISGWWTDNRDRTYYYPTSWALKNIPPIPIQVNINE